MKKSAYNSSSRREIEATELKSLLTRSAFELLRHQLDDLKIVSKSKVNTACK